MTADRTGRPDGSALPGGPAYGDLVAAARRLADALAWTVAPDGVVADAAATVAAVAALLERHVTTDESRAPAIRRRELPGHGHPGLIPVEVDLDTLTQTRGRVMFRPAHIGGGAVHGGMIPLLFDDIMGVLASKGSVPCRTAYLTVNYRSLTPIGVELTVAARVDRTEGRKIFVVGSLHRDDTLLAEAEALFIITPASGPIGAALTSDSLAR